LSQGAQPQRVEADETCRVAMIVGDRAFLKGDKSKVLWRPTTATLPL
jgi:hypothetical protein